MRRSAGWRLRSTIVDSGLFHCPIDGGDRFYELTDVRRWFMPFGFAIFPTRRLGKYVVCAGCGSSYTEDVLVIPTSTEMLDRFESAGLALMQALYSVTSEPKSRARLLKAARGIIAPECSLVEVMVPPTFDDDEMARRLSRAAEFMDVMGRVRMLSVAIRAAARDQRIAPEQLEVIERAGTALMLPATTITRLITASAPRS